MGKEIYIISDTHFGHAGMLNFLNYDGTKMRPFSSVEEMKHEYDLRRRYVVYRLNEMGLACFEPKGAFYAFPSIQSTGMSSEEFCERLLYEKHVAIVPGTAVGESGEGFARISYAYSVEHIKKALEKMEIFVAKIKAEKHTLYQGDVGPILTALSVKPAEPAQPDVATF